ncbi:MAG: hypothetical protein WBQ55_11830 [Xanthobacteraceae bacterium]
MSADDLNSADVQKSNVCSSPESGHQRSHSKRLSNYQRKEAIKRRDAGETLASIAKSYAVDISMISRL